MPQETKTHGYEPPKLEGKVFRPHNFQELVEAIELAFDYRGDVTIETSNGATVEGYLFNRETHTPEPCIYLFPKDQLDSVVIFYADIVSIAFTGEDTAFGQSWEAWMQKTTAQRQAEATKRATEAAARGHL
jgi:hypothetical protein